MIKDKFDFRVNGANYRAFKNIFLYWYIDKAGNKRKLTITPPKSKDSFGAIHNAKGKFITFLPKTAYEKTRS